MQFEVGEQEMWRHISVLKSSDQHVTLKNKIKYMSQDV